jgi:hypothetical protein
MCWLLKNVESFLYMRSLTCPDLHQDEYFDMTTLGSMYMGRTTISALF